MNEKNYDLKNKDEPTASTHSDHILLCSIFILDLVFTFVQYFTPLTLSSHSRLGQIVFGENLWTLVRKINLLLQKINYVVHRHL